MVLLGVGIARQVRMVGLIWIASVIGIVDGMFFLLVYLTLQLK